MSSRQRGRARNNRNNHNNQFLPAYQRLLNRAWNLLRRHNGWAGADPNADDLSSNDSDSSGPAVGNLNQIDENVEEIPPIPHDVDIVPLPLQQLPNNNNNVPYNNTPPHTPPSSPKSTPNRPPPAPIHQRGRNPISHISDDDYDNEAARRYAARQADKARRGEPPEQPSTTPSLDIQDDEVLNNDEGITAVDNREADSANQNVALVNNDGDNLEGTATTNNTNSGAREISNGEEGLVLKDTALLNDEEEVLNDISSVLEEEDTEELVLDFGVGGSSDNNNNRESNRSIAEWSSRMNASIPPFTIYNAQINMRIAQFNSTTAGGGDNGGSSYSSSSSSISSSSGDSGSRSTGDKDVSMGSGNGSGGGDMSVDSGGSYTYEMDKEEKEEYEEAFVNELMISLENELDKTTIKDMSVNENDSSTTAAYNDNEMSMSPPAAGNDSQAAVSVSILFNKRLLPVWWYLFNLISFLSIPIFRVVLFLIIMLLV